MSRCIHVYPFVARNHGGIPFSGVCPFIFSERAARGGGGGGGMRCQTFSFSVFFPVQQTTSGIGHRVKYFFRVGNQYAECEKQQQQQQILNLCYSFRTLDSLELLGFCPN